MENSSPQLDPARLPELYEVISQLSALQEEADVIQCVLDSALKLLNAEHAFLHLENSHEVHIAPNPASGLTDFFSSISETIAAQMAQARASIYVSDWQEFLTFANDHFSEFLTSHTAVTVSLRTSRGEIGTLAATRDTSAGTFTSEETSVLEFFAKWVALALDVAQASKVRESCVSFVHDACFDIRTPLTFIAGFSDVLREDLATVASAKQLEMLELLNKQARKVNALANVLPDLAQIEFNTLWLALKPVDVAESISKMNKELSPQLEAKGHILKIIASSSIPPVMADEWRFHQILTGLISNADKFMLQEGQITVSVIAADRVVRISVTDNGIGIQPDEQAQVFSKWFHANLPDELRHLQGVGVSLYIYKHAVEGMGGTIGFESEPGQGSTFWFTLPIAEQDAATT